MQVSSRSNKYTDDGQSPAPSPASSPAAPPAHSPESGLDSPESSLATFQAKLKPVLEVELPENALNVLSLLRTV